MPEITVTEKLTALDKRREEIVAAGKDAGSFTDEQRTDLEAIVTETTGLEEVAKADADITAIHRPAPVIPDGGFDQAPAVDASDRTPDIKVGYDTDNNFASFGEQLQAMHAAATGNSALSDRLTTNARYTAAAQGAGEAIDSDGGFLVQTDFSTDIMVAMRTGAEILSRVRRVPISGNSNGIKLPGIDETSRADGSRWGGIRGYWVDEGGSITTSRAKIWRLPLEVHKIAALGDATDELLADAAAMTSIFTDGFAEELRFKVEDAIFEGDGAGKPTGILTHAATIEIAKETNQAAETVIHDNLKKMWARLPASSRANAVWLVNQDVEPALDDLAKVIGTGGVEPGYVSQTDAGVTRIKGRPVVAVEYGATLGTVGDIVLADLGQYAFIDKGGIKQDTSIHVRFTTDEMTFRATYRVDGNLLWKSALTPFKGSNTQSPVITLATRA